MIQMFLTLTDAVLALKREKYLATVTNMGQSKICIRVLQGTLYKSVLKVYIFDTFQVRIVLFLKNIRHNTRSLISGTIEVGVSMCRIFTDYIIKSDASTKRNSNPQD